MGGVVEHMCNSVLAAHGLLWTTMFERWQSCLVGCEGRGNSYQNTLHVVLYVILYYCTPANLLSQNNIATHVCTRAIRSCTQPFTSSLSPSEKVTAITPQGWHKKTFSGYKKGGRDLRAAIWTTSQSYKSLLV